MGQSQVVHKGGSLGDKVYHGTIPIGIEGWYLSGESLAWTHPKLCNYEDCIKGANIPSMGHPLLPLISWSLVSHALQRL